MLLLATWKQVKSTLHCLFQSTRPVVNLLPPLSSSSIPTTRHLSSVDASVVFGAVFVLIFLLRPIHHHSRLLGPVVYPSPPPLLSQITRTRHVSLILCWRLYHRHGVLWPVLLFQRCHCRRKYPPSVNKLAPPPSETFTQTRFLKFINWCLRCRRQDLGLPVNTPTPPSS